jgi:hypothetical protein
MHENRSESAGIAAHRVCHPHTGKAYTYANAHRGEANVNASGHFCQ